MTEETGSRSQVWGVLGLIGALATIGLAVAGIAVSGWPPEGPAGIAVLGAAVALVGGLLGRGRAGGAAREVAEAGALVAFVVGSVAALQTVVGLTTPTPRTDTTEAAIGVALAVAALLSLVGVTSGRPFGRVLGRFWRRADGGSRVALAGGFLEFLAWLALVSISGSFGIGFDAPAGIRFDALPAIGLAAAVLAYVLVGWSADRDSAVRLPVAPVLLALAPAAVAAYAAAVQFDLFRQANAAFQGRFTAADTTTFYFHLVAVGLLGVGVIVAVVDRFRRARRERAHAAPT